MGKYNIIEEINQRVLEAITPATSIEEHQALRAEITNKVIEERAKVAKLCPDTIKGMQDEAQELAHSFNDVMHKLGL